MYAPYGYAVALAVLLASARVGGGGSGEASRPRGVSPARAALYAVGDKFTCLDGSATVPYSFVNDDFCDCRDGSDEPGTAACANGSFHCANVGHAPLDIPSSRVNDGVCDCCDASDEYAGAVCGNVCEERGREAREEAQRRASLLEAGARLRADLAREGVAAKAEMRDRLEELRRDKEEADRLRAERESLKVEAEALEEVALARHREREEAARRESDALAAADSEREARELFARYDADADGRLSVDELASRATFDRDRDGRVSEEEARFFLGGEDRLGVDDFVERSWPLVKPRLMAERGSFRPPEGGGEDAEDSDDAHEPEGGDEELEGDESEPENEQHEGDVESEAEGEGEADPDPDPEPADSGDAYDDETKRLVGLAREARASFSQADEAARSVEREIEKLKASLEEDYGPEEEFASLAGRCLEYEDREYSYRVCPFDRASQRPKSGGGETSLGSWAGWADGHSTMTFTRGASCWNGPDRSARVAVRCGLETAVVSASEPNRCEYALEMETPAACNEGTDEDPAHRHDEL